MSIFVGLAMMVFFLFTSWFSIANATSVLTEQEAAKTLKIQYIIDKDEVISGKITNESPHAIKDPELLVEYHWLWAKEFRPGQHSPGRVLYVQLNKEIQPGNSFDFPSRPKPSLLNRNDVIFMPEFSQQVFSTVFSRSALLHIRKPKDTSLIFTSKGNVN